MAEPGRPRRLLKRSKWLTVAGRTVLEVTEPVRSGLSGRAGAIGATHMHLGLEQSVAYVKAVYDDYLRYAGIPESGLAGKRVLEVGAGDNFGVALKMLAAGADQVVAVDRFPTHRNPDQQRRIYATLVDTLEPGARARAKTTIRANGYEFDDASLRVVEGLPIEQAAELLDAESFDLVVSRAVMEHVGDIETAYRTMDMLLRPGGAMAHKVDLSDHGLFTPGGHHPLTFLTIPDRAYRWMGGDAGLPNRRPRGDHVAALVAGGYDPEVLVTHLIDGLEEIEPHVPDPDPGRLASAHELVEQIRERLLPRYRERQAEELATSGIFMVARKR